MPKDEERKELTQEEIDARDEKFRTFFTTSVAQVPEEMTRGDDGAAEKPNKGLFGRLFRREKTEPQADGAAEESSTGEIRLGGEEQEKPSELELVLKLEEETEPSKPETPESAGAASAPQPGPEKPQVSQLDMEPARVRELIQLAQDPISLETPVGEEEDAHLEDFIQDDEAGVPADEAGRQLLRRELMTVLKSLTPREERVIALRFGLEDGRARTLEELGREFNVTRERVRQIEAKALRKLRHPSRAKRLRDYLDE